MTRRRDLRKGLRRHQPATVRNGADPGSFAAGRTPVRRVRSAFPRGREIE